MRRLELSIERLSKSGDGVAQVGGRAVFVPGALPGETVLAEVVERGKALRGELQRVLVPSPARRPPACPLADTCGGCDWLHVDEQVQLEQKLEIVLSALEHVGGLARAALGLRPTVASPKGLGSRRRAVLHQANGRLGFFGRRSHTRVEVNRCPALTLALETLPGELADALGPAAKDLEEVHLLESRGRVTVSLHLKGPPKPRHRELLEALVRQGRVVGAVLVPGARGAVTTYGQATLEEDGVLLRPDGFAQANAEVNALLVPAAVEALGLTGAEAVLELYSGNGNFTFALAPRAREVVAVESAPISVQLAQQVARARALSQVRFVQGDAEQVTQGLLRESARFDRLLLDPPRVGAQGVGRWAARLLVSRVVYVACDPAALARDAADLLKEGYRPVSLQLFDLFPQTRHIEAVYACAR